MSNKLMSYSAHIKDSKPTEVSYEKHVVEIQNLVKDLADLFGRNSDKFRRTWAERLVQNKFTIREVEEAVDHCADTVNSLPSYSEFKALVRSRRVDREDESLADKEHRLKYEKERSIVERVKEEFLKNGSQEKLDKYIKWWFKEAYSTELLSSLSGYGLTLSLYEHCALLDFYEARYKIENIKKVIEKKEGG